MKRTATIIALAALVCSCARPSTSSTIELAQMAYNAWVTVNRTEDWTQTEMGSYIIAHKHSSSGVTVGTKEEHPYLLVEFTVMNKDRTITSTSSEWEAKKLGTYLEYNYYGPTIMSRKEKEYVGVEEIVSKMEVGDSVSVAIPGWLLTYTEQKSIDDYILNASSINPQIYNIKLVDVIADLDKYQIEMLKKYAPQIEEYTKVKEGLFYNRTSDPESDEEIKESASMIVNYVCRRFDGQVVDTNIPSVAKEAFGEDAKNKSLSPMKISWGKDGDSIKQSGGGSLIKGFTNALYQMKTGEKGTAYMVSSWGYGSTAQDNRIPAYCPLIFELELLKSE